MLYKCQNCEILHFNKACQNCGEEEIDYNISLQPNYFPEFQYKSQGVIKDFLFKKRQSKELQVKLDSVLENYEKFRDPYFINYVHVAERESDEDDHSKLNLFYSVLLRLGFSDLREIPLLTSKLVLSTELQFEYDDFVSRTSAHLSKSNLDDSLRYWIEDSGSMFRTYLPMFIYLIATNHQQLASTINFTESRDPLNSNEEYQRLFRKSESIYFAVMVDRFQSLLENFDPSKFVTMYAVDAMSGHTFEEFLVTLFATLGFSVQPTAKGPDQGADLFAERFGKKIVIQAKNYSHTVGNSAVQEALAAKAFYNCDEAMVVTNSLFTKSAKELAEGAAVQLVDRKKLQSYLDDYNRLIMEKFEDSVSSES